MITNREILLDEVKLSMDEVQEGIKRLGKCIDKLNDIMDLIKQDRS